MFQQLISRIREDDNPRLHRVPFMVMWIASYGIALCVLFAVLMILIMLSHSNEILNWISNSSEWVKGLLSGLIFGLVLSMIQTWVIRRRFGYVPKFWRSITILGGIVSGIAIPTLSDTFFWFRESIWINITVWSIALPLCQSLVLMRVNRHAWMMTVLALCLGLLGGSSTYYSVVIRNGHTYGYSFVLTIILQVLGTGGLLLYLMAHPRDGIVPKREKNRQSLSNQTQFHPITFVAFWTLSHYLGWVTGMFCGFLIPPFEFTQDVIDWMQNNNIDWILALILCIIIGFVSSSIQKWLIKQQSGHTMRFWILFSTVGWTFGSIRMLDYILYDRAISFDGFLALALWFITPTLFQTISIWDKLRGAWLWLAAGIVTTIIVSLLATQLDWQSHPITYAMIFGGIVYGIITASTYLLLLSQQKQTQAAV